jgi:hypothetical protein
MTEKTVLTYGDMKQTFESLPERHHIDPGILEACRRAATAMNEFSAAFYGSPMPVGWCMPSREGLYTMGYDEAQIHNHPLNPEEIIERCVESPVPVEEDSVFAPREVEVECEIR